MARKQNIDRSEEFHAHEKKRFRVPVTDPAGNPVDISGVQLEWVLLPNHRSIYATTPTDQRLLRSAAQFLPPETLPGGTFPSVAVWEVSEMESGGLRVDGAGQWYWHALWDRSNDALLVYGGAILLPGIPVVVP